MQRKIHNQTLFVAALSVYLGLLIVGAPPQVLAQTISAESVKFQEKGRNCVSLKKTAEDKLQEFEFDTNFFLDYADVLSFLAQTGREFSPETFTLSAENYRFYNILTSKNRPYLFATNSELFSENKVEEFRKQLNKLKIFFPKSYREKEKIINLRYWSGNSGSGNSVLIATLNLSYATDLDVVRFTSSYNSNSSAELCDERNEPKSIIYKYTEIFPNKNEVLIVTRLPRAGLDALLKASEKAN